LRILLKHRSRYEYARPATLGPHTIRLRPASHAKANVETYALHVEPECRLRWQQDPAGNHVARLTFSPTKPVTALELRVELAVDIRPINPFDFFVDPRAEKVPFAYPDAIAPDLAPYLDAGDTAYAGGPRLQAFLRDLPREGPTVDLVVALNAAVHHQLRYVIREEAGVWTPEQTLAEGRGSCRDSATLLVAVLRSRGLAARFVSGYLVQLTDEGMIPDAPKGVDRDVVDLHAWAEVYVPGGGWVGLDATSGLLCGEGHIPLACTARPAAAAPIDGTSSVVADRVLFEMQVGRLGHEPRPTAPFTDEVWSALIQAGERTDAALSASGVELTVGGEPTFTSRLHADRPEWNTDALGDTKWTQGLALATALRKRLWCVREPRGRPGPRSRTPSASVARSPRSWAWTRITSRRRSRIPGTTCARKRCCPSASIPTAPI
jgi:transglutaminase-like putative cysteine protease